MRALTAACVAIVIAATCRNAEAQYQGRYGLELTSALSSNATIGRTTYDWIGGNSYRANWIRSWYSPGMANSTRIRDEIPPASSAARIGTTGRSPAGFSGALTQNNRQPTRYNGNSGRPQIPAPPVRQMPARGFR